MSTGKVVNDDIANYITGDYTLGNANVRLISAAV